MNYKKLFLTAMFSATMLGAMAVPAQPGVRTFRQSDGSELSVRLIGDEHFHTYLTTDGLTIARANNGDFYYHTSEGLSTVKAHNPELRKNDELEFIKNRGDKLSLQSMVTSRQDEIMKRKAPGVTTRAKLGSQVPTSGTPKVPVLLLEYKDKKFKDADPKATFNDFFATGDKCAAQYFADQSNGKFTPEFDVYGPYTLSEDRAVYGANDDYGNDIALGKMVAEGTLGLDSEIDFSQYDNDGDGECDVLIILYAGDGEASSSNYDAENAIWPCQWSLSSSDYQEALTLDGTTVDKFACFNEMNGRHPSQIDGIGTFCHEFSHCLGLPDFYDTNYIYFGMGPWSLMDSGSYNNDTYTPVGYSAYEKEFMGWIDIDEGEANTFYTLPVFNQKSLSTDKAVKLSNPLDGNEFFILENRAQQGWDKYMAAEGLFIYHVTYNEAAWNQNYVNTNKTQRMTPVPSDNNLKMNRVNYDKYYYYYEVDEADLVGDLWPYNGNNSFTDTSAPSQKINIGGGYLGLPVTEITLNDDGTASFWIAKDENSNGGGNSGITEIEADETAEYYNLQGVKIEKPQVPGIYIIKKGTKSFKIAL